MRLGIDFGTTRTVVAAERNGSYPVLPFSWKNEIKDYIPSLIAVKGGNLYFGWDAADRLRQPEVRALRSVKRLLGQLKPEDNLELAPGLSISMLDLLTRFLLHVKRMIVKHGNLPVGKKNKLEVMVATPANANSNQRYITLEAFRKAGFSVLGAMNEPSAAALEFLHYFLNHLGSKSPKRHVFVYDLGGGTFDISAITIADGKHDVIAYEGIAKLGGDDFDEIILDMVLEQIQVPRNNLDSSQMVRLLEECRERKEGIRKNTRNMVIDVGEVLDGRAPVVLDTARVYARCGPIIEQSLAAVQALLSKTGDDGAELTTGRSMGAIYLAGGSVSFPPVARVLKGLFKKKVKTSPHPQASTAIGLAIAADPQTQIQIRESVSRHFGVWREKGADKVFDPIFLKDQRVSPDSGRLQVTRCYQPRHNIGLLRYLECNFLGTSGEPEGDISIWKNIYFPYDPELADRKNLGTIDIENRPDLSSQEVVETYVYDPAGIIRVEIENHTSGYHRTYRL
jgi:molecular chaperone DnaK (HSP70)